MNRVLNPNERFYSLDVLRGVAALCVVFWHWQNFFFTGIVPGQIDFAMQPLYEWLYPLYTKGWLAVDLFFTLSGFILFWLYSKSVAEGEISLGKFALLRFSRLYPLHFATLLIVLVSQTWLKTTTGSFFVFQNNDSKHFLLNIFFASSWGIETGLSFNGPIWSVSVEILLYAIFFAYCRLFTLRVSVLAIISMMGFTIIWQCYPPIGRGIGAFFLGGCVFFLYRAIIVSLGAKIVSKWALYLLIGIWLVTIATLYKFDQKLASSINVPFLMDLDGTFQRSLQEWPTAWPILVLFPMTILSLSLIETQRGSVRKRASFLGNISYSSYQLHFPLQILFSVVMAWFEIDSSVFYSTWLLLLFFLVLIGVSLISFIYFEIPVQRLLRERISNSAGINVTPQ